MPARRQEARVTPLELFFDLVFVLAITQCTGLMAADPSWHGIGRGLLLLGLLWWAWVGYAWLTSVVDPEEGGVRIAIFLAMAALLVVALCMPEAFGDLGTTFAVAYAAVRAAHILLFVLASREDAGLRQSVLGLMLSTAVGCGIVVGGSLLDGSAREAVWLAALVLDMGGPLVIPTAGWRLMPEHFCERHGLIVLIALGESIVAIGVGAEAGVDGGVLVAAVLGMAVAAGMWWTYFDVVSTYAARHLAELPRGQEQNELARDAYSYLHFPMVAGIVLSALGLKATLAHVNESLGAEKTTALLGGVALYLAAHVGFAWRDHRVVKWGRIAAVAVLLVLLLPAGLADAWVAVGFTAAVLGALVVWETVHFATERDEIRHAPPAQPESEQESDARDRPSS